jgi:lipopolysaccharide export LptBFGC system permease protein LptF
VITDDSRTREARWERRPEERPRELLEAQRRYDQGKSQNDRVARNMARVEIHKKFAIPFACIAFGVLGLPLGITNRRGGKSSGFTLSIAIIVFYYLMINNGEQLAANGKIPAALGMWGANLILFVTGLFLLGRACLVLLRHRLGDGEHRLHGLLRGVLA